MSRFFKKKPTQQRRARPQSTVTSRASTFSYRANRMSHDEVDNRRTLAADRVVRKFHWHHLPTLFVGSSLIVCAGYITSLSSSPKMSIQAAEHGTMENIQVHDQKAYTSAAQTLLRQSIADHTKITFDSAGFTRRMNSQFPEIAESAVILPLMGRRPIVELILAKPAFILSSSRGNVVLDKQGRAIAKTADVQNLDQLSLPLIGDQSGIDVEIGKGALPSSSIAFITTFVQQLKAKNITVNNITLPPAASEVQFRIDGQNYMIKTSTTLDARQSAGTYLALKQKLENDHTTPGEYVDVRVEEKAFFK